MASKKITLQIQPRGKPIRSLPQESTLSTSEPTRALYNDLAKRAHISPHRLRITRVDDKSVVPYSVTEPLSTYKLRDGTALHVKDLGPQLSWRAVYVIEYAGPLLMHPLVYLARPYIWPGCASPSNAQTATMLLMTLHFLKRELETVFVHRFSNATMPVFNVFRNSGHYWGLAGALVALFSYKPGSPTAVSLDPTLLYALVGIWAVMELLNANAHWTLKGLRRPGTTERGIPHGLGFAWVTCPNYLFEELGWCAFLAINRSWSTIVYMAAGTYYMAMWARGKEQRYRREFPDAYKKKKFVMLPGLI